MPLTVALRSSLLLLAPLFVGCAAGLSGTPAPSASSSSSLSQPVSASHGRWHVEVETVEQQALNAIISAPSEFLIDFSENHYAWERANIYFDLHTTGKTVSIDPESGAETISNRETRYDNFWYSVRRTPGSGGFLYRVAVVPREASESTRSRAAVNSGNLSRFIRDGILERSFIKN